MVIAAVIVLAAIALVAPRTGWLEPRPRYTSVPTCAAIMSWPTMEDAVRTAFGTIWEQRDANYVDFPDSPLCLVSLIPLVTDGDYPKTETPWYRHLTVALQLTREEWESARSPLFLRGGVREARERFQDDRRNKCQTSSSAKDLTDEPGIGDEAFSCWTMSGEEPERRLGFRASNLRFVIKLTGGNYKPSSPVVHDGPELRADLEQNTRCIAEALATHFDARVAERHTCGGTPQAM